MLSADHAVEAARRLGLVHGPVTVASRLSAHYRVGCSLTVVWLFHSPTGQGRSPAVADPIVTFRASADDGEEREAGAAGRFDAQLGATGWLLAHDPRLPAAGPLLAADPGLGTALSLAGWCTSAPVAYEPGRWLRVEAADRAGRPLAHLTAYTRPTSGPAGPASGWSPGSDPDGAPGSDLDLDTLAARYELVARWFDHNPVISTPEVLARADSVLGLQPPGPGRAGPAGSPPEPLGRWSHLGHALGHLHDLPVEAAGGLAPADGRWSPEALEGAAEAVARVRPDTAQALLDVLARLGCRPDGDHGDVLLHGGPDTGCLAPPSNRRPLPGHPPAAGPGPEVTVTGWDDARLGPPGADVGMALAELLGHHRPVDATGPVGALVHGYRQRRALPAPDQIRWHVGAALIGIRAHRVVTRLDPAGLRQLPAIVQAAADVLDGRLLPDHLLAD